MDTGGFLHSHEVMGNQFTASFLKLQLLFQDVLGGGVLQSCAAGKSCNA